MQAFKRVGVIITLSALSFSSAWATDDIAFVAKATLDGFKVVPPVLTSKTGGVCLEFKTQESTAATGEALALVLAGNPGALTTQPHNETITTNNIRLYFGQHFANGRPIATLWDNASNLGFVDPIVEPSPDGAFEIFFSDFSDFRLSDIQFQGQQLKACCGTLTIRGVGLETTYDDDEDDEPDRLILPNDKRGLKLIKLLIRQGLLYVVINSNFKATVKGGEIIGYEPRKGVIDGDGEVRGTLRLAPKDSRCPLRPPRPPPPEPAPDE